MTRLYFLSVVELPHLNDHTKGGPGSCGGLHCRFETERTHSIDCNYLKKFGRKGRSTKTRFPIDVSTYILIDIAIIMSQSLFQFPRKKRKCITRTKVILLPQEV